MAHPCATRRWGFATLPPCVFIFSKKNRIPSPLLHRSEPLFELREELKRLERCHGLGLHPPQLGDDAVFGVREERHLSRPARQRTFSGHPRPAFEIELRLFEIQENLFCAADE